jgi:prophage regulatory protein
MYAEDQESINNLMKLDDVIRLTTLSKSTIYKLIKSGKFPVPINLCGRAIAFVTKEIFDWIGEQIDKRAKIKFSFKEEKCN